MKEETEWAQINTTGENELIFL